MSSIDTTAVINAVRLAEQSAAPATPASGFGYLYELDTGELYFINDAGTTFGPLGYGQPRVLFSQTADLTVADTVTETNLLSTGVGSVTLPANTLEVGGIIRITMRGHYSTTGTPTYTLAIDFGGTELATTGAKSLATGGSNIGWELEFMAVCRTTGASGTVSAAGVARMTTGGTFGLVKTSDVTLDTTGTLAITAPGTWGTASASNTITCQMAVIEHLGIRGLS